MANTKLTFIGTERSETDHMHMTAFVNTRGEMFIEISDQTEPYDQPYFICLDKPTSVKLVKNLKSEISKMD